MSPFARHLILCAACLSGSAAAQISYPAPYANSVNSVFGPRAYTLSKVHKGIDYLQNAGTGIPAASSGYVYQILDDADKCGIRLYLMTDDAIEIGYCHLFTISANTTVTSGGFTLVKNQVFTRPAQPSLRRKALTRRCNIILANTALRALVPRDCSFAVGTNYQYNGRTYAVENDVADRQLIAPVGNSGSASATGAHLHLNYGRGKDNPLVVTDHPNGSFCARLADAGASTTACDPVATTPTVDAALLATRKYIDIRIDSTGRLDLDQIRFSVPTQPAQVFALQYGGTDTSDPQVNGNTTLDTAIKIGCTPTPAAGQVYICPKAWLGQPNGASRLETVFRLGIDPLTMKPGNYQIGVELTSVTGATTNLTLPLTIPGGIPTSATLSVPDLQQNWSGLPASIALNDLVSTTAAAFSSVGNSTTCGTGERGFPLYSSSVPASAAFYAVRTTIGVPYTSSGPGVNRRNCSSFIAILKVPNPANPADIKERIWVNATGRGQRFGGVTLDWESQVRFDSGDPWTGVGRSCVGGTVANSGFFGANWTSANCTVTLNY